MGEVKRLSSAGRVERITLLEAQRLTAGLSETQTHALRDLDRTREAVFRSQRLPVSVLFDAISAAFAVDCSLRDVSAASGLSPDYLGEPDDFGLG